MHRLKILSLLAAALVLPLTAQETWPSLPKGKLSFKALPGTTKVKTEKIEVSRDGNRIAQITKIDRDDDGRFEEFVFSAFVSGQRVFVLNKIGGTHESSMFFSRDDTMVNADLPFPEKDLVALVITSRKHGVYEIFTRHADGYYWAADEESRKVVDAFFRAGAEAIAPLVKPLLNTEAK